MTTTPTAQDISTALNELADADLNTALDVLGIAVDSATDLGDEALLRRTIRALEEWSTREAENPNVAIVYYFLGNAWSSLRHLRHRAKEEAIWDWEGEEHAQELLALRRATLAPRFGDMSAELRVRVLTNLGNVLNNIGRIVEALECFDRALAIDKHFGMAKGNKGLALETYAKWAYDGGHRNLFLTKAASLFEEASEVDLEAPGAAEDFGARAAFLRKYYPDSRFLEQLEEHDEYGSADDKAYRLWCLKNQLFLHPVNDMGTFPAVAHDPLLLPTVTVASKLGTAFHGFYNQLKREYASARWHLYCGLSGGVPDFVDDVKFLNTLDDTILGGDVEETKLALRSAYSLFDKIASFVNERWELGQRVNYFRWFWYERPARGRKGRRAPRVLRSQFRGMQNASLRALFWLAKDLADDRELAEHHEALEPDAQSIAELRNHLEHGYVKVQAADATEAIGDPLAYRVTTEELADKALRVLKLSRAALIYLCLAVHRHEQLRAKPQPGTVGPMGPLPVIDGVPRRGAALRVSTAGDVL